MTLIGQNAVGVHGIGDATGVLGDGASWHGVAGISGSTSGGFGVYGASTVGGTGVAGDSTGWHAVAGFAGSESQGAGVWGEHRGNRPGVWGKSAWGWGVYGESGSTVPGVYGKSRGTGVRGESENSNGVSGFSNGSHGVAGTTTSTIGAGVYGEGQPNAGWFEGSVTVRGNLYAPGKSFKIDHPLDPQNKYLLHNAVESSERKNVYDGVATLEADGTASVDLPEWFEALNGDFRYQLTAVGGPAPNLHVAEEISENRFKIAGGEGGMRVCWQVTGSRKDPWAAANPLEVEQEKPQEERGRYLQPELYGAPEEQRVMIGPMEEERRRQMLRQEPPPQAPEMLPPGWDRPQEERLRQIDELRRQVEAQHYRQQIDELRAQIKELRGGRLEEEPRRQIDELRRQIEELRRRQ
jgi:hypothetical protein